MLEILDRGGQAADEDVVARSEWICAKTGIGLVKIPSDGGEGAVCDQLLDRARHDALDRHRRQMVDPYLIDRGRGAVGSLIEVPLLKKIQTAGYSRVRRRKRLEQ